MTKVLKKIALICAFALIMFTGYMAYMTSQHPYYLDFAADAAVSLQAHPYLKYGKPAKPVLINRLGLPCIPYPSIHYDLNSYSHWVMALQSNLNAYHGFKLKVDGHYGKDVARAVAEVKIRYNMPSKNGSVVDYSTWYIVCTQKSKSGYRFRPSGPNNTYWKSHNLVYKLISYPKPATKPAVKTKTAYYPVPGRVTMYANWHAPRFPNRLHMGIDIAAPNGRQLVAIYAGRITITSSLLGGKSLWINAANGGWYYAHMKSYAVKNGQYVKAGQVVGWVDSTGIGVSGPHLHIGWKKGGRTSSTWHNPYSILKSLQ